LITLLAALTEAALTALPSFDMVFATTLVIGMDMVCDKKFFTSR
jgi:hypothetical protein